MGTDIAVPNTSPGVAGARGCLSWGAPTHTECSIKCISRAMLQGVAGTQECSGWCAPMQAWWSRGMCVRPPQASLGALLWPLVPSQALTIHLTADTLWPHRQMAPSAAWRCELPPLFPAPTTPLGLLTQSPREAYERELLQGGNPGPKPFASNSALTCDCR